MARIVLIRHGDEPDDDRVVTYFRFHGIEPEIRKPFNGEALGAVDSSVLGSVLYGGPFNVFEEDRHPFLHDENRWIADCVASQVPLLGICQGAQSIAHVLGAPVGPKPGEPHEFGYYEIRATAAGRAWLPERLVVAESHFHEFQVPAGGELLAASDGFAQQAFRYGPSTFAFQFHAEQTPAGFRRWQQRATAPYGRPGVQSRAQQDALMAEHDRRQHDWFMGFLDRLFGPAIAARRGPAPG
jgi:GMP synthase (glutamine-hydrolysing)